MSITEKAYKLIGIDTKDYRYEFVGAGSDMGIRFLDTKLKLPYRLDEKSGDLIGMGQENWHKRIKITKETDIDPRVPYFRKLDKKFIGKDMNKYDMYADIKGDKFIHEPVKGLFIGIDKENKGTILHVSKEKTEPTFGTIPLIHKPIYLGKRTVSEYPFGLMTGFTASTTVLRPFTEALMEVNPVLAVAVGSSPITAGIAYDIIRNKKLSHELKEDVIKLEHELKKELMKEGHAIHKWEKAHFEKKLEKVL